MPRLPTILQLALAVAVAALGGCNKADPAEKAAPAIAAPAAACEAIGCLPSFQARTIDGADVTTDDLRGKVALILFWASWCEPCTQEGPSIDAVYQARKGDRFAMLGLSRDTVDDAMLRRFRAAHPFTYPVARATPKLEAAFGRPAAIPAFLLYGRDGKLRWRMTGALPAAVLEREIDAALADRASSAGASDKLRLQISVLAELPDPARLAALRAVGPSVVILAAENISAAPRVINSLRLDAWITAHRPDGVVTPAVAAHSDGTRPWLVVTAGGARVAIVPPSDLAAATAAVAAARAEGQADLVVAFTPDAGADAVIRAGADYTATLARGAAPIVSETTPR